MDHVFVFPHVVRLCPDLNTCLFFHLHPDKMRELNMRLREFTDGTWARKAQIKVPTQTKTFFSFCRRMKWSIPQHRFGTLNSKSIHGSSNLTVGTLQETLEVFCLNVMPRHLLQHNQETPRLTIMIPWPGGSSRQSRSSPAPCPCSRWCFAHKLACGKAEASREGSSQKRMLGGREKRRQATTNMLWSFGMAKEGLSKWNHA